jgi:hypothetical protein
VMPDVISDLHSSGKLNINARRSHAHQKRLQAAGADFKPKTAKLINNGARAVARPGRSSPDLAR